MIIDFSQHSEPVIHFAHVFAADEIDLDDETARLTGNLEVNGTAERRSEIAHVTGNLCGVIEIACSRCLQPVAVKLEMPFEVEFVTLENYGAAGGNETELHSKDLSLSIYDGERIDLKEIVREQILLDLPVRQLCAENCAGLCLTCGANKNTTPCECKVEEIDPRWNALKELKSKK